MGSTRWAGITVASGSAELVIFDVPTGGVPVVVSDESVPLQTGDRARAYPVFYARVYNRLNEMKVTKVAVKASAVSLRGTKMVHLEAAEVRGIVIAAAAAVAEVVTASKAGISRNFGERKADDYIKDDGWWKKALGGVIRKGSREAALLVLSAVNS